MVAKEANVTKELNFYVNFLNLNEIYIGTSSRHVNNGSKKRQSLYTVAQASLELPKACLKLTVIFQLNNANLCLEALKGLSCLDSTASGSQALKSLQLI